MWFLNVKFMRFSNKDSKNKWKSERANDYCVLYRFWINFVCRNREIQMRWCENWFENHWKSEFLTSWCFKKNKWFLRNKRNKQTNVCWLFNDFVCEFWCESSKIQIFDEFSNIMFAYMFVKFIIEIEYLVATSTCCWFLRWFRLDFECRNRKIQINWWNWSINNFFNFCLFLNFLFLLMCTTNELLF